MSEGSAVEQRHLSLYLKDLIKEVERYNDKGLTNNNNTSYQLVLPSVSSPFDVDIAHILMSGDEKNEYHLSLNLSSAEYFNNVVWESCRDISKSSGSSSNSGISKRLNDSRKNMLDQLVRFADSHFQTPATVTAMTHLNLGCFAIWLSWYPSLFSNTTDDNWICNSNIIESEWHWERYKDTVVSGLLEVLNSRTHDPKCLSIAVACLSFLVEQHSQSERCVSSYFLLHSISCDKLFKNSLF
jgi:hypothetical protein